MSAEIQQQSIKSLESTLNKLSNAYTSMTEKGANTILVKKRMCTVKVGLESLRNIWHGEPFPYDDKAIDDAIITLKGLIPSIEKQAKKAKEDSPQMTLIDRRLTAIELAIHSMEDRFEQDVSLK